MTEAAKLIEETKKIIEDLKEDLKNERSSSKYYLEESEHYKRKLISEIETIKQLRYRTKHLEDQINRQAKYIAKYTKDINSINIIINHTTQYTDLIENIITTNENETKLKDAFKFQNLYIEDFKKTLEALLKYNNELIENEKLQDEYNQELKKEIEELNKRIFKFQIANETTEEEDDESYIENIEL